MNEENEVIYPFDALNEVAEQREWEEENEPPIEDIEVDDLDYLFTCSDEELNEWENPFI